MEAAADVCSARMVSLRLSGLTSRYWISRTWVEAEYPGIGVQSDHKGYFLRYKIRFDWVESQGSPWWLQDQQPPFCTTDPPRRPLGDITTINGTLPEDQGELDEAAVLLQRDMWRRDDAAVQEPDCANRPVNCGPLPGRYLLKRRSPFWSEIKPYVLPLCQTEA
jgi:hypothetical protein